KNKTIHLILVCLFVLIEPNMTSVKAPLLTNIVQKKKLMLKFYTLSLVVSLISARQYHFLSENMTWTAAQRYCRQKYTDLATIDNMDEMKRLITTVNGTYSGSAWIGLYDDVNSWRCNSSFSNWSAGQPDNAGNSEYCTAVSFSDSGNWTDENCNTALPFICYRGDRIRL
uniref:C-type lectin domain-containing protein n=1 Tax=Sinocyclocheilus rhinocerous TaxID=307959 RepID=A0A673ID39_9TELE